MVTTKVNSSKKNLSNIFIEQCFIWKILYTVSECIKSQLDSTVQKINCETVPSVFNFSLIWLLNVFQQAPGELLINIISQNLTFIKFKIQFYPTKILSFVLQITWPHYYTKSSNIYYFVTKNIHTPILQKKGTQIMTKVSALLQWQ